MGQENQTQRINARTLAWYAADPTACVEGSRREMDQPPESGFKRAVRLRPWKHFLARALHPVIFLAGLGLIVFAAVKEAVTGEADEVSGVTIALLIISLLMMGFSTVLQTLRSSKRKDRIGRLFGLEPRRFRLLASTLDSDGRPRLKGRQEGEKIVGWPEAILRTSRKRGRRLYVVGVYKPEEQADIRHKYELILHMGLLQEISRRARGNVLGMIAYAEGETVKQEFDPDLYSDLCGLTLEAMWAIRTGQVSDPRPLAERETEKKPNTG